MIVVAIKAGLGNQLFQYACARALSLRSGQPMKLDVSGFESSRSLANPIERRDYLLSHFAIASGESASAAETRATKYPYGPLSRLYRRLRSRLGYANVSFDPGIFSAKSGRYLDGYWQSELYFKDREKEIREEFRPRNGLGAAAEALLAQISSDAGAVSLHVRRGDNARSPASMKRFGMPPDSYYPDAAREIARMLSGRGGKEPVRLYVFSDEIDWVRENLRLPFPAVFVSRRGIADWEEIFLMAACRHHVIANSTFSWWGAWLNQNRNKIVVAPKRWANLDQQDFKDLVPQDWIRM